MYWLWSIGMLSLLSLAIQDFRSYEVSLWLLLLWLGIVLFLNCPLSINILYSFGTLVIFFLSLSLISFLTKKPLGMGLGDWIFLASMTLFFPPFEFVLFTVISNVVGILLILVLRIMVSGIKKEKYKKAPMISVYSVIFLLNMLYEWSS